LDDRLLPNYSYIKKVIVMFTL